ncbi:hypothetical protein NEMBOFW57_007066 [Staphylotrichum longicolle]|uniref:Tyrosinase copper-binding domain-containing protein n=1 Tax=Staphylotrichum longicolle TaxID=669026 RepID=A0AAD4HUY2_9PEZI|nr:hypothetical protein NEMBOFW57_007066 [Staphylotrichum longicolle]
MRSIWGASLLLSSLLAGVVAQDDWRTKVKVQRNGFYPLDVVDKLEEATMTKVEAYMAKKIAAGKNNGCTLENAGYMNYDRYTKDAKNSALFNGNATSMGGNGEPDPRYTGLRMGSATIKSAGGGGCVTQGPFKEFVVQNQPVEKSVQVINFLNSYMATVGPGSPVMNNVPKNPVAGGGGYNPRCMRRDVNSEVALGATAEKSYNLITLSKDINTFYNTLLTPPVNRSDPYNWGIHNSGHYISGGDPGGDPMVSPGDPIFYFHHAMLDRLWWIWQMQDPDTRVNAQVTLGGASTSRKIDLKWLIGDVIPVLEAHDGLGGHGGAFCHVYV